MQLGVRRSTRAVVVPLVVALALAGLSTPAGAHVSALNALTVDFVIDQAGLVLIDAAANRDSYEHAPSPDERAALADQVLSALGIPRDTVQINRESSKLYHEVGFTISLHTSFANTGEPGTVRIDTGPLQALAAGSVGALTIDVCRVDKPGLALTVDASRSPSAPDLSGAGAPGTDRTECRPWTLNPDDPPVVITARAAMTGAPAPTTRDHVTMVCNPASAGDPTFVGAGPLAYVPRTLQAQATGPGTPPLLVAEAILEFRVNTRIDLAVPRALVGHLTLGPRDGPRATRRLTVPKCHGDPTHPWTVSVVRLWIDEADCVDLAVKTRRTSHTLRLGVGVPCPV